MLLVIVVVGMLLPMALLWRQQQQLACGDASAPSEAARPDLLAALALVAQQNVDLLRNMTVEDQLAVLRTAQPAAAAAVLPPAQPVPHPPPQAVVTSTSTWLRIAIFTLARKNAPDYLSRTLESLVHALPQSSPLHGSVDIVVVNNQERPEEHHAAQDAPRRFGSRVRVVPKRKPSPALVCPSKGANSNRLDNKGATAKVQRQTCDLVAALNALVDVRPAAAYVMMMEDDWLLCPNAMLALQYFVEKARTRGPPQIGRAHV